MKETEQKRRTRRQRPKPSRAARQGREASMRPRPLSVDPDYKPAGKLSGRCALVTGGDSGIGRAVAIAFADEGAHVAIVYRTHDEDAAETKRIVETRERKCLTIKGDVGDPAFCKRAVDQAVRGLGKLDILVNNAAEQHEQDNFLDITPEQLERTFRTNIFGYFYITRAALPYLRKGGVILNTASVTAYRGSAHLVDYSATKGAIVAFTRSLSQMLADKGIRVNAVAPGPIWTPLITESFEPEEVQNFGTDVPLGRAGQPEEVAACFVFLASDDASYMTGQVLHPNGGEIVNA